jgi:hypothetical protein
LRTKDLCVRACENRIDGISIPESSGFGGGRGLSSKWTLARRCFVPLENALGRSEVLLDRLSTDMLRLSFEFDEYGLNEEGGAASGRRCWMWACSGELGNALLMSCMKLVELSCAALAFGREELSAWDGVLLLLNGPVGLAAVNFA